MGYAGDTEAVGAYGLRLTGVPLGSTVQPGAPGTWPVLDIAVAPHPPVRPEQRLDEGGAVIELLDGERTLVIDRAAGTAVYYGPPLETSVLAHPYLGPAASLVSRWRGREVFHGGAFVAPGGRAIAVLGSQEAGKSTLLAALAAQGVAVLGDDLVVVEGGRVFAGPRTIDLRAEPAPRLRGHLTVSKARGGSRWRLALPPVAPDHELGGWVFLRAADAPGVTVTPVPAAERLARLAPVRGYRDLPSDPRGVLALAALPMWDVARPVTWDALDAAADALLGLAPR